MLRVVILNDYATVRGGADQVAIAGARALADAGVEVLFVGGCGSGVSPRLEHRRITFQLLEGPDLLEQAGSLRGMAAGMWSRPAAAKVAKILAECDPKESVVHVHGWTKALTSSIFPTCHSLGFRPVVTLHDYFVSCPNGAFFEFPAGRICRRRPLSASCLLTQCDRRGALHKGWRSVRQFVQAGPGGLPRHLEHAIIISRHSEAVLEPALPPSVRRYFVRNPAEIDRQPCVQASRGAAYLFVGRMTVEKAPDDLAEAALRAGVEARFCGDGYLKENVLKINPRAAITGWMERDKVLAEIRTARALVFPSIWHETFGLTVAEALAQGVPVIVSDACAAAEQVVPGVNGLLYRGGEVADLARVLELFKDDALVEKLGRGAYDAFWNSPPTLERHAKELGSVYDSVLASQVSPNRP